MPLDAVLLTALTNELSSVITGAKVDKIHQPEKDEIILALRTASGNRKLLLSAGANHPRLHMTEIQKENPASPPMFCMLLRKHLIGARITAVTQPELERIVMIHLSSTDEMGEAAGLMLILELLGRKPNIILTDAENRIIDCVKRVAGDIETGSRSVIPGMYYKLPPRQDKLDPRTVSRGDIVRLLSEAPAEISLERWIMDTFLSMPPLYCREIVSRSTGATDTRLSALGVKSVYFTDYLHGFFHSIASGETEPWMLIAKDGTPNDFSYTPITQYGDYIELRRYDTFSELLEGFYAERDQVQRVKTRSQDMRKKITTLYERTARKLENQRLELASASGRERARQLGDILMANTHTFERGVGSVKVIDLYDESCPEIEIQLNPLLTPSQNAARYYKEYTKKRNAETFLTGQIAAGEIELEYLSSVLEEIDKAAGERDLAEIRDELISAGYLHDKSGKKPRRTVSKPMRFTSTSGYEISVGRNNTQNDELTLRTAFKSDIWLHTQKIPGSHVIISCKGILPDSQTIIEGAQLAAYYSRARDGSNVPVDYTFVKHVKKPSGAKPGMVIYENQNTVHVTPSRELADRLAVEGK